MLNVTVLDFATAIGPRTYVESKTNADAGFEAFRRESSGLLVNCIIPGFAVLGLAHLIKKPIMGRDTKLGSSWADGETLELGAKYWAQAQGATTEAKVDDFYRKFLKDVKGIDGDIDKVGLKSFNDSKYDFEPSIKQLRDLSLNSHSRKDYKTIKEKAISGIVNQTLISEHIKIGDSEKYFGKSLKDVLTDMPKIVREFVEHDIKDTASLDSFVKKATKLVNVKSLAGLGLIIPLAMSMQPINRWITSKRSGKKGAPIYKDYKSTCERELTKEQKAGLLKQKLISTSAMVGVALLSMMKKPSLKMLQFKGLFPSMDQARIISTASFASRMLASEDENELRESTVRDIATFSSFYFLGDYAAKLAATVIEKTSKNVKLLNKTAHLDKDAGIMKKAWHWVKNTSLKASDELPTTQLKTMRSWCQLANIAFSLVLLGVLIPLYTRGKTDKKHAEELKKNETAQIETAKASPQFKMNEVTKNAFSAIK